MESIRRRSASSLDRLAFTLLAFCCLLRLGFTAWHPFALRESLRMTRTEVAIEHRLCKAVSHCERLTTDLIRLPSGRGAPVFGCRIAIQLQQRDTGNQDVLAAHTAALATRLYAASKNAGLIALSHHLVVHIFDAAGHYAGGYGEGQS